MPVKVTKEEKAIELLQDAMAKAKVIIQEESESTLPLDELAEGETVKVKDAKAKNDKTKISTDANEGYAGEVIGKIRVDEKSKVEGLASSLVKPLAAKTATIIIADKDEDET